MVEVVCSSSPSQTITGESAVKLFGNHQFLFCLSFLTLVDMEGSELRGTFVRGIQGGGGKGCPSNGAFCKWVLSREWLAEISGLGMFGTTDFRQNKLGSFVFGQNPFLPSRNRHHSLDKIFQAFFLCLSLL